MDLFSWIVSQSHFPAYIIFLILVLCGIGLPIPEDIPLIALGYLWYSKAIYLGTALWVAFGGILIGDTLLYYVGYFVGPSLFRRKFLLWLFTPKKVNRAKARFRLYGLWAVFLGRFIMGIRAVVFFTAGATRVPFRKFFLTDLLAAVLSIPIWIILGYIGGPYIEELFSLIKRGKYVILLVIVGLVLLVWVIRKMIRAFGRSNSPSINGVSE